MIELFMVHCVGSVLLQVTDTDKDETVTNIVEFPHLADPKVTSVDGKIDRLDTAGKSVHGLSFTLKDGCIVPS